MAADVDAFCTNGYCDRPAVAAVHGHHGHPIIRPDHLTEGFVDDWRCLDCALDAVAAALSVAATDTEETP